MTMTREQTEQQVALAALMAAFIKSTDRLDNLLFEDFQRNLGFVIEHLSRQTPKPEDAIRTLTTTQQYVEILRKWGS
jgi:hypothetical protein